MSKLWKQEWKYHIIFIIITTLTVFLVCHSDLVREYDDLFGTYTNEAIQSWMVLEHCNWLMTSIRYQFLEMVGVITFGCLLVKKVFIYWIEQNGWGREFIQSLPIRKVNRVQFHLIMDLLQLVLPVFIYGMYEYMQMNTFLETIAQLHIPWLLESMLGMMLTLISYTVMLLGVLYLIEAIFVGGSMKLIGFIGTYTMARIIFNCLFDQLYANKLMQNIMGFFTMESVGGAKYDLLMATNLMFDDIWSWEYGSHFAWFYEHMDPPLQYMGEWLDYTSLGLTAHESKVWLDKLNGVYSFSDASNYIFYVLAYLVIGLVLIGAVIVLTDKKDLSKDGFYFDFGRVVMSGMIALTVLCMITDWHGKLWLILLDIVAVIIVFFLMLYLLDSNRPKLFAKKEVDTKEANIS